MKYRIIAVLPTGVQQKGKMTFTDLFAAVEHAKRVAARYKAHCYIELLEAA